MATTNFTNGVTLTDAEWFNDVDSLIYQGIYSARSSALGSAAGDGTTNDTAAITTADALGKAVFLPNGIYDTTLAATDLDGPYWGDGQIRDVAENKRGKWFSAVKAAPSSEGTHTSVSTAFNGDLSKNQFAVEHRITGAATLSQPTTGYEYTPEAYPFYGWLYNESGHNNATGANTGRTGACFFRIKLAQAGQGDVVAYNFSGSITSTRAGATDFLASPAAAGFNGDLTAGVAGCYLNPYETTLDDGGYDVAAFGAVYNFTRTVSTAALSCVWGGARYQSNGSAFCDAMISGVGKWKTGIDFSMSTTDFDTTKAAISLKAGQRIYLNNSAGASGNLVANWRTTTFNDTYIDYDSGTSRVRILVGGNVPITLHATAAADFDRGVNVPAARPYYVAATQVVGAQGAAVADASGGATQDAEARTAINTLLARLRTHGLIAT